MVIVSLEDSTSVKVGTEILMETGGVVNIFKIESYTCAKPGKHGSSKKICKSRNIRNDKTNEFTLGATTVMIVKDKKEYVIPVYSIESDKSQIMSSLENETYECIKSFSVDSQNFFNYFIEQNKELSLNDLTNKHSSDGYVLGLVCMDFVGTSKKYSWINEIGYFPESDVVNNVKSQIREKYFESFKLSQKK